MNNHLSQPVSFKYLDTIGAAGGGTYGVQLDGFPRTEISFTILE